MKKSKLSFKRSLISVFSAAFACILSFAGPASAQVVPAESGDAIVVRTSVVGLHVSVTDRDGRAVTGLAAGDFSLKVGGTERRIDFFGTSATPATVGIVFDTSESMSGAKIELAREALKRFIRTTSDKDEFVLVDVGTEPVVMLDRCVTSFEPEDIVNRIRPTGRTALFDAVALGLERVAKGHHQKKIIIVISDGEENNSRLSRRELLRRLREADAFVYAVGFGGAAPVSRSIRSGRETLEDIAEVSGGRAYFPSSGDIVGMDDAFENISVSIRNIFTVGFYATPAEECAGGRLDLKVTLPTNGRNGSRGGGGRLTVRARRTAAADAVQNNQCRATEKQL